MTVKTKPKKKSKNCMTKGCRSHMLVGIVIVRLEDTGMVLWYEFTTRQMNLR